VITENVVFYPLTKTSMVFLLKYSINCKNIKFNSFSDISYYFCITKVFFGKQIIQLTVTLKYQHAVLHICRNGKVTLLVLNNYLKQSEEKNKTTLFPCAYTVCAL